MNNNKKKQFLPFDDAKAALKDFYLDFNCVLDYKSSYKEVSKDLPSNPLISYASEWVGWPDFFGKEERKKIN